MRQWSSSMDQVCISFLCCRYLSSLRSFYQVLCFKCSDEIGDRPRPLPAIKELKAATDVTDRKHTASWDFDVSRIKLFSCHMQTWVSTSAEFISITYTHNLVELKLLSPSQAADGRWKWIKPPPMSQKGVSSGTANESGMKRIRTARNQTVREKLLRGWEILYS